MNSLFETLCQIQPTRIFFFFFWVNGGYVEFRNQSDIGCFVIGSTNANLNREKNRKNKIKKRGKRQLTRLHESRSISWIEWHCFIIILIMLLRIFKSLFCSLFWTKLSSVAIHSLRWMSVIISSIFREQIMVQILKKIIIGRSVDHDGIDKDILKTKKKKKTSLLNLSWNLLIEYKWKVSWLQWKLNKKLTAFEFNKFFG